jgi:hypothetical protein
MKDLEKLKSANSKLSAQLQMTEDTKDDLERWIDLNDLEIPRCIPAVRRIVKSQHNTTEAHKEIV